MRHRTVALGAVLCVVGAALSAVYERPAAAAVTPFPSANVTFAGHGFGPGYGMGQWGAFGFAAVDHWTYHQILVHYYSASTNPVTPATLTTKNDGQLITVAIEENNGIPLTVTSASPFSFVTPGGKTIARIGASQAARAFEAGAPGTWVLQTASSCQPSSWKTVATGLINPVAVPASLQANAPSRDLLTLCRGGVPAVSYRGRLEAYDYDNANTGGRHFERTLNIVALEQYVADVTPEESPTGWATYGGTSHSPQSEPWGFQELEAQAVAVRSYLLASKDEGGWYGYADICDNICQSYTFGVRDETALSVLAARDTAGQYLVQGGAPAPTEYDSSSGGYTETLTYWNGKPIFEGVPDAGDAVCIGGQGSLGCNPEHTWTTSITVRTLENAYPAIGTLVSVKVTQADVSGRVLEISLVGEKSTVTVSGDTLASNYSGFFSTRFAVTDGPGATEKPPAAPVSSGRGRKQLGTPGNQPPVRQLPG